jgi:hypothetical protein
VRKAPTPAAKPEGEAKPKAATRVRKKPAGEDAAKVTDGVAAIEPQVEASTEESAKPAVKAKTTVRRVTTKKTGA